MKVTLKIANNNDIEFELPKGSFTIGRGKSNDIVISHEGLSRNHCKIDIGPEEEIIITDLNSTNGTFIADTKIEPGVPTLFKPFLNIAIGPIQGLIIDFDSFPEKKNSGPNISTGISKITPSKDKSLSKKSVRTTDNSKHQSKGQKTKFHIVLFAVIAIILCFLLVFYFEKNEEEQFGVENINYSN